MCLGECLGQAQGLGAGLGVSPLCYHFVHFCVSVVSTFVSPALRCRPDKVLPASGAWATTQCHEAHRWQYRLKDVLVPTSAAVAGRSLVFLGYCGLSEVIVGLLELSGVFKGFLELFKVLWGFLE